MIVHRPDWQRTMSMRSWTRGSDDALIIFTSPAADAGNSTLKLDQSMWMFTPKINQVIKLPASMMAQSWMGSDFSYNDLARSDQIVNHYTHTLINTEKAEDSLIKTLQDSNSNVALHAVKSLKKIGTLKSKEPLLNYETRAPGHSTDVQDAISAINLRDAE